MVLGVLWIVSGKSVAVKWAEYVLVTVTYAGRSIIKAGEKRDVER